MKNFFTLLLIILPILLNAQYSEPNRTFAKRQTDIQLAIGLLPTYSADHPETIIPPIQVGTRWLITDNLSLGIFTGYSASESREQTLFDSVKGRWKNQTWFLGIENGFHYTKMDNWDIYGGYSLFYQHIMIDTDDLEFEIAMEQVGVRPQSGKVAFTAFLGTRFAFSPNYTVFAELGYGISLFKLGVGFRL